MRRAEAASCLRDQERTERLGRQFWNRYHRQAPQFVRARTNAMLTSNLLARAAMRGHLSISARRLAGPRQRPDRSRTHFEDHVERRLGGAAEAPEARFSRHLTQSAFTGLCAEPQAHFLRQ